MNLCIKENTIKNCPITQEYCCSPENSIRVQRVSCTKLLELTWNGLDDIEEAQKIAHELSKLSNSTRKATKASLTDLEHRLYDLCARMDFTRQTLYFNLLMEFDEKNVDGCRLAAID